MDNYKLRYASEKYVDKAVGSKANTPLCIQGVLMDDGTFTVDGYTAEALNEMVQTREVQFVLVNESKTILMVAQFHYGMGAVGTKYTFHETGASAINVVFGVSTNESGTGIQGEVKEVTSSEPDGSKKLATEEYVDAKISNFTLTDETTGKKYKLTVVDGNLTMTEVES